MVSISHCVPISVIPIQGKILGNIKQANKMLNKLLESSSPEISPNCCCSLKHVGVVFFLAGDFRGIRPSHQWSHSVSFHTVLCPLNRCFFFVFGLLTSKMKSKLNFSSCLKWNIRLRLEGFVVLLMCQWSFHLRFGMMYFNISRGLEGPLAVSLTAKSSWISNILCPPHGVLSGFGKQRK